MKQVYMPCLKTSVSEFRALSNLKSKVLDKMLPLFELTRGRRSKTDRVGSVSKNKNKIADVLDARPFVLDLTRDNSNSNHEIESFFDPKGGYENWCEFVDEVQEVCPSVYPVLQNSENGSFEDLEKQVAHLSTKCEGIAIRVNTDNYIKYREAGYKEFLYETLNLIAKNTKLLLIVDSEHIRSDSTSELVSKARMCFRDLDEIVSTLQLSNYILFNLSASFPLSINQEHSGDSHGFAELHEREFHEALQSDLSSIPNIYYGDYACIYQFQKPTNAYNWVPRIDYPSSLDKCIYYRYRETDGGYVKCASKLVVDDSFKSTSLKCWGTEQIVYTANSGKKAGGNPSFWISVRSNIWMTRVIGEL